MNERILAAVASLRREMIEITRRLVAIPDEKPCRAELERRLRRLGLKSERHGECLLAFHGRGKRTLYFHGHYDVVPAQSPSQFRPTVKGQNLFGRGSSDMKSGLAAMIGAVKAIEKSRVELDGRIGLCFVPDEETGGRRGSEALLRAGVLGRGGIGMLTAEPTGGVIWNASRGAISLRVTVPGKTAHVGLQHLGINAFEKMIPVAGALLNLKREVEARGSILMLGGRAEGGTSFNAVPAEFSFTIDRRTNPGEDLAAERAKLMEILRGLKVEILQEGRASGTAPEDPLAMALQESVKAVSGKRPELAMCPGLLETRFYAGQGIPALAYGPGLLSVSHGPNEFVPVKNIADCAAAYALTAARVLSRS